MGRGATLRRVKRASPLASFAVIRMGRVSGAWLLPIAAAAAAAAAFKPVLLELDMRLLSSRREGVGEKRRRERRERRERAGKEDKERDERDERSTRCVLVAVLELADTRKLQTWQWEKVEAR